MLGTEGEAPMCVPLPPPTGGAHGGPTERGIMRLGTSWRIRPFAKRGKRNRMISMKIGVGGIVCGMAPGQTILHYPMDGWRAWNT